MTNLRRKNRVKVKNRNSGKTKRDTSNKDRNQFRNSSDSKRDSIQNRSDSQRPISESSNRIQKNDSRQLNRLNRDSNPERNNPRQDDDGMKKLEEEFGNELTQLIRDDNSKENSSTQDDDEFNDFIKELEKELGDQPYEPFALERTDTNWADDVIEDDYSFDPSTPEGIEIIRDTLEGLFIHLETNQILASSMQSELEQRANFIKQFAPKEIEDFVSILEKAEEVSNILSRPMGQQVEIDESELENTSQENEEDIDPELKDLELELQQNDISQIQQVSDFLEQTSEENIDRILQIEDDLEFLQGQNKNIYRQIRQLQEKLGILGPDDKKGKISFKSEQRLKKVANIGLTVGGTVAGQLATPVVEVPIKIAKTSLAAISLAKTIKHIQNMKKTLENIDNSEVKRITIYAMSKKTNKAVKKGLDVAQVGTLATGYSIGKALYKKVKGTRGKNREENAKSLHQLAIKGDMEAAALIRELVGSSNIVEALKADGWKIIINKLAST